MYIYVYMYICICLITEYLHLYVQVLYLRVGIKMGVGLSDKLPPILYDIDPHSHEIPGHVSMIRNGIIMDN